MSVTRSRQQQLRGAECSMCGKRRSTMHCAAMWLAGIRPEKCCYPCCGRRSKGKGPHPSNYVEGSGLPGFGRKGDNTTRSAGVIVTPVMEVIVIPLIGRGDSQD